MHKDLPMPKSKKVNNNYLEFNISDEIKNCFQDHSFEHESKGLLLKGKVENIYNVLATSNNTLYTPYIKIDLTEKPKVFTPKNDINQ